jgi:hypothetical protein
MDFFFDRSIPYPPKNEIAFVLCSLASDDPPARLLLLRLYLPGLSSRWLKFRAGGLPQDELEAELVAGFLERATKTHLGAERLTARLLDAARDRARQAIGERLKRLASEFATAEEAAFEAAGGEVTDAAEEVLGSTEASDLLRRAVAEGVLEKEHAEILWLTSVEDLTIEQAARRVGSTKTAAGGVDICLGLPGTDFRGLWGKALGLASWATRPWSRLGVAQQEFVFPDPAPR